jgi:hypothetical protein
MRCLFSFALCATLHIVADEFRAHFYHRSQSEFAMSASRCCICFAVQCKLYKFCADTWAHKTWYLSRAEARRQQSAITVCCQVRVEPGPLLAYCTSCGAVGGMLGRGNLPRCHLKTSNPTWPDEGTNPGRQHGKQATNLLRYSTAAFGNCILYTAPVTSASFSLLYANISIRSRILYTIKSLDIRIDLILPRHWNRVSIQRLVRMRSTR